MSEPDVPWLQLIRFHKEICRRTEEAFFSLPAGDSDSDRWSSLARFEPAELAGPWSIPVEAVVSRQLLAKIRTDGKLELMLG